jgi:hypothetical protein
MKRSTGKKHLQSVTYNREPISEVRKIWGRLPDAVAISGLNKDIIYRLIREGLIESYVHMDPAAKTKSGVRLINLESVNDYLRKRFEESQAEPKEGAQ